MSQNVMKLTSLFNTFFVSVVSGSSKQVVAKDKIAKQSSEELLLLSKPPTPYKIPMKVVETLISSKSSDNSLENPKTQFLVLEEAKKSNFNIFINLIYLTYLNFQKSITLSCDRIQDFITKKSHSHKKNKKHLINCSMSRRRCLCDTIYPIIKLSQWSGVIPLSIKHTRNSEGRKIGDCHLVFKWTSISAISNTIFMIIFLGTLPYAYSEIRNRMSQVFNGTDLYAFTFQSLAMVVETTIILIAGRFYKTEFTKGWQELNQVYHAMCDSADSLSRIKCTSYVASIVIIGETLFFLTLTLHSMLNYANGILDTCISIYIGAFYIQLTTLLPYILSSLFFFICLLIRSHFLKIADMISTLVEREKQHKCGRLASQIDSMRVLHEQLCSAAKCFEKFFGVQVLLTLCTGCFTMVTGAYALIIQGEGISAPNSTQVTTAWGMQLYCATVFIFLILISGQLVINSANASAPVLNAISLTDLDDTSQRQVIAFLHKISAFPLKMSAVNITNISTTFLASAATNITTYLLVLMQFKLTIENKVAVESLELMASTNPEHNTSSLLMNNGYGGGSNNTDNGTASY